MMNTTIDKNNMNVEEMTTEELELMMLEEAALPDEVRDTDFLLLVTKELSKRHHAKNPTREAASDIRMRAWWKLVKGEMSQAEYRDTILFTALSEDERKVLEERISRDIFRAMQCQGDDN